MTSTAPTREREVLKQVTAEYQQKGYTILLEPHGDKLPPFLKRFRPDALATRGDENIVIELSARSTDVATQHLGAMAEEVARHPGWKLEVVWVDPRSGIEVSNLSLPSIDEIREQLKKAKDLYSNDAHAAAFLFLWSLLEAASWHRLSDVEVKPKGPQSPIALIKNLISFGYIDQNQFERMSELASLRNATAHGQTTRPINREAFDELFALVEQLTNRLAPSEKAE